MSDVAVLVLVRDVPRVVLFVGLLYLLAVIVAGLGWLRRRTLTEPGESYELQAPTSTGGREWEPKGDPGLSPGSLSVFDWASGE